MLQMTWKQFKDAVATTGLTDDDCLWFIDTHPQAGSLFSLTSHDRYGYAIMDAGVLMVDAGIIVLPASEPMSEPTFEPMPGPTPEPESESLSEPEVVSLPAPMPIRRLRIRKPE